MAKDNKQESFAFMLEDANRSAAKPPFPIEKIQALAKEKIYFGTSSWKYRGWEGMIYRGGYSSEALFQKQSLKEYSAIFPCVGLDFTYYNWPSSEAMATLLDSTSNDFLMFPKVTKFLTMRDFPAHPSQGKWAGQKNPEFMNVNSFEEKFSAPLRALGNRVGALIFEYTHLQKSDFPKFAEFFKAISRDFPIAIEIRSPEIVNEDFYKMLIDLDLIPAFNFWTKMPLVREQWRHYSNAGGKNSSSPLMIRALLKPGRTYEEAVQNFQPYSQVRDPFPEAQEDIQHLISVARETKRPVYVLVNNRLEGSAPRTIASIVG